MYEKHVVFERNACQRHHYQLVFAMSWLKWKENSTNFEKLVNLADNQYPLNLADNQYPSNFVEFNLAVALISKYGGI